MKGISNIMKQAQQVQAEMKKMQEEIAAVEVEGNSGGGVVRVLMNGKHQVLNIKIDDSLLGGDKDMLEDLLVAALNDATNRLEAQTKEKYAAIAGGLNLPGGIPMPF